MNTNAIETKKQPENVNASRKKSRAEYRREQKADRKAAEKEARRSKAPCKNRTQNAEELKKKAEEIMEGLKAQTWRDLETRGRFDHDRKLSFIKDHMLIVGCDIGSEKHYFRAIDSRGIELGKKAVAFPNSEEGYKAAREWAAGIAALHNKTQIVLGFEPTGHYWFTLISWMVAHGVSAVQVNPYAVKCTKEVSDNSQLKDDRKDPKVIAELVKNGNYGMPYLPEGVYAEMREYAMLRDQLMEDRIRDINRLHRNLKYLFPEYTEVFQKIDGAFSLELLKKAPMPKDMLELGEDGIRAIWKEAGLKGRGYTKAAEIVILAARTIGLKGRDSSGGMAIRMLAARIQETTKDMGEAEAALMEKCRELPHAENILEIKGIGWDIMSGILAQLGDIRRFDSAKEIQKMSGLGLVECSSGKHKGETKISRRGRKRLRYWLFQGAKSVVAHSREFQELHAYYTTRPQNPLKKMQSLIAIACKLLRVIYTMLKTGCQYDPDKMMRDIIRPQEGGQAA